MVESDSLKLKSLNDGFVSYKHASLFTLRNIYWWTGVMWIIVIFLSAVWTHSDGTHSLQRIHWWASDVMLNLSKSVLMKKLIYILDGLRVSKCSAKLHVLGTIPLRSVWIKNLIHESTIASVWTAYLSATHTSARMKADTYQSICICPSGLNILLCCHVAHWLLGVFDSEVKKSRDFTLLKHNVSIPAVF